MSGLIGDVRYAARTLLRSSGFTAVAVVVLALGIGVNSAVFSVANAVLLRPLPYPDPDSLVELYLAVPGSDSRGPVSAIDSQDWRERNHVFEHLALINTLSRGLTLAGGPGGTAGPGRAANDEPEQLATAYVHPEFFSTMGVQPALGRPIRLDENQPGLDRVVVLSHRLWLHRFGGDASITGRGVTLDGQPFTVVGVMPPGFRFPEATIDLWAPESLIDASRAPRRRDVRYQRVVARLKRGVTLEQAGAEMSTIAGQLMMEYPETNAARSTVTVVRLHDAIVGGKVRLALLVLLGAVGLVLLISCANVGNLLFARMASRQREIAVRLALGAGRFRVMRMLLTESLLLALAGGALGLLAGAWSLDALLALSRNFLPGQNDVVVDRHVVLFALLASLLAAAVFGAMPAIKLCRSDPQHALRDGGRGASAGPGRRRLQAALVVSEMALAVVLVVAAVLMLRSFQRLVRVEPGFEAKGVITVSMNASSSQYPDRQRYLAYYREVLARVHQVPGVRFAGSTRNLPLASSAETLPIVIEGRPEVAPGSEPLVPLHQVSPDYFRAMGIPLLQGRTFAESDDEQAALVAIVSRAMADRFWPAENPVGRAIRYGPQALTVVGVVGDVRQTRLDAEGDPALYVPQLQNPRRGFTLVIRAAGDPRALEPVLRAQVRAVDPEHPILRIAAMEDVVGDALSQPRLMTLLLGSFGGLAFVLAMLGVYGVIAYTVSLRTHEFGIRMALGAKSSDVVRMVLRDGARLALAGVFIGVLLAFGLTRFMSSQLYEVSTLDGFIFAEVAGLMLLAGLAASCIPSIQATRVDPLVALRCD